MNALQKLQADWDAEARFAVRHDLPMPGPRPTAAGIVAAAALLFLLMVVVLALVVAFGPDLALGFER